MALETNRIASLDPTSGAVVDSTPVPEPIDEQPVAAVHALGALFMARADRIERLR